MEPISFALAIIAEARTVVASVQNRLAKYREGQQRFQYLTHDLDLLVRHIAEVERLVQEFPTALPASAATLFKETLAHVRNSFLDENSTMPSSLEKAFVGSSSAMGKLSSKAHQLARAKAISDQLDALQNKVDKSSNQLQHLISVLVNALKVDEHQAVAKSNHDELVSKLDNLRVPEIAKEVYNPVITTPAPSHTFVLDFNSKDDKANPTAPEGRLKQSVLHGQSSEIVIAAAGAIKPAYGILGMAGVGKTVALQGLGHDEEIKRRFDGGVLYMKFGRSATLQTTLREIAKIMTLTGATTNVENVKNCSCLRDAVDYAVTWFEGKICLFLLDDLWPAENMPPGYFQDLRQLLRGSAKSRMAISTRSVAIASEAGCIVDFEPRIPLGPASVDMFMSHATGHSSPQASSIAVHDLRPSVSKILAICGGLPIALSVTGCAVSKLLRIYGTFEKACDVYAVKLEKKRTVLGDRSTTYGMSLKTAIMLSLEYLEVEFAEWMTENSIQIDTSISNLYISLCVVANQAWVPVSVLGRMWKLEEDVAFDVASLICGMSLATLEARATSNGLPGEVGVVLHDLQLDFCQQKAIETKQFSFWHARLLNGYLEIAIQPILEEEDKEWVHRIVDYTPRPWWSEAVPDDGYIHANLSRHLSAAGYTTELASLLLDGRWTQLRGRIGGILALKTDFELFESVLDQDAPAGDMKQSFESIFKAVQLSWGRRVKGRRVFQFHVCGRLAKLRKSNAVVDAYLKSIEKCTPKPCLLPVSPFFPDVGSSLIMEILVGKICGCVACSPCGRYIACGAGGYILIAKTSNGEIIQRTHELKTDVSCVAFTGGSKDVVSGLFDGTVIKWKWELSVPPERFFEGHKYSAHGITINSHGRQIIYSSSGKTLRIWDTTTTARTCELHQSSRVYGIAVSADCEMIAFGLGDGKVKVVDSVTKYLLFEDAEAHKSIVSCISFSPNGSYLATGSHDHTIRVWNTRTWTRKYSVLCVSFSPDGRQLASSSEDGTIRVWDVASGECAGISPKVASFMTSVSFTVDGHRIVSGSNDGVVRIWDARLGAESRESTFLLYPPVRGATISQNGLRVASASRNKTVRVWNTHTGEQVGVPLKGHTKRVACVAFSPDGRKLVSGSYDNSLRLWDMETRAQIGDPFEGHTRSVTSVSFSFDGLRIVSGSEDSTVRIWNAETHDEIGEALQVRKTYILCVSESCDGCHIVSRDNLRNTVIWNRNNRSIIWKSKRHANEFESKITDDAAESIIRSCGQQTPHLWPKSFRVYAAELYCVGQSIYSNLLGEKTLLADTLMDNVPYPLFPFWSYHTETNVFASGRSSDTLQICKLITK